jgi:ABC-type phosphate transport system substrate-binding protein
MVLRRLARKGRRSTGRGLGPALAFLLLGAALAAAADDFVVIVHPSVAGASIRRADLAAVFLRKAARWGSGGVAVPVDRSGTSPIRQSFSEAVLGMPVAAAVQYWQKQMFEANPRRPPAVKGSDAEVIAFVAKTEGAVGYVSKAATLPPEVRAVALID